MARSRKARLADIDEIALALPEVTREASDGDRPAYSVGGKAFAFARGPRKDAFDPETGQPYTDVLAFHCTAEDKEAMVADPASPWFTTPHWNGYNAVLLLERDLGRLTVDELREVLTDAWLSRAPKRLAAAFLEGAATDHRNTPPGYHVVESEEVTPCPDTPEARTTT
jgi:hypothetical protein